jgi:hypothetical protein
MRPSKAQRPRMPAGGGIVVSPLSVIVLATLAQELLWVAGPVDVEPSPSLRSMCLALALMGTFALGFVFTCGRHSRRNIPPPAGPRPGIPAGIVAAFLVVGALGAVLQAFGKAGDVAAMDLESIYRLRLERAEDLMRGRASSSRLASIVGFATYPACIVGICATFRWFEHARAPLRVLAVAASVAVVCMTLVSGGRGTLFLLGLLLAGAGVLRRLAGLPWIPWDRAIRVAVLLAICGFIAYSSVLWKVRSSESSMDAERFLEYARDAWGMQLRPWFQDAFGGLLGAEGVRAAACRAFYMTQSLSVLERVLAVPALQPMLGLYEVDVLAGAVRLLGSRADAFLADSNAALESAKVYGFFAGAWGGLVVDFGIVGAFIAAGAWGALAGRSWRAAVLAPDAPASLFAAFWLAASAWSFVSSPIGFSNAALVLAWFAAFALVARPAPGRPVHYDARVAGSMGL